MDRSAQFETCNSAAAPGDIQVLRRPIKYRPDIDGLRALAVISVVAFHAGLGIHGGFVGVDIFFVISGFLIGTLVYKEIRGHSFSLARFYSRRVKRILPALFGMLLFTYIGALLLLSPEELRMFAPSALATITSTSNIWFWHSTGSYFSQRADLNPLLMTWTLGVEEQFYIFLPLLLLSMRKMRGKTQMACVGGLAALSLSVSIWGTAHRPGMTFYLLPTRAWELGAGVLLAMLEANRLHTGSTLPKPVAHILSGSGFILICIAVLTLRGSAPFPGYAALLPVCGAVLIIGARDGIVNRVLSLRPVVFVGLISYSWYLWHWPLLSFARISSDTQISKTAGAAIVVISFICAVLSYKFIEQPFRRSETPIAPLFRRYAVVAVVMGCVPVVFYIARGLPQRNPSVAQMEAGLGNYFVADKCLVGESVVHPPLKAPCLQPGSGPAVALVGDSHAGAIAEALRSIVRRRGYRFIELNKEDCPALEGVSHSAPYVPALQRECTQFNRERLDYIARNPHIKDVVLAGFWSKPLRHWARGERYVADGQDGRNLSEAQSREQMQHGLNALVTRLQQAGKTVYLVQDNPTFAFDPLQRMRVGLIGMRGVLADWLGDPTALYREGIAPDVDTSADREARRILTNAAAANPRVHLFDLRLALCTSAGCRFAENNKTLYVDAGHLDLTGAQQALRGFSLPATTD